MTNHGTQQSFLSPCRSYFTPVFLFYPAEAAAVAPLHTWWSFLGEHRGGVETGRPLAVDWDSTYVDSDYTKVQAD